MLNPITLNVIVGLLVIIVLLIFSAMISGSEVAFFSLSPSKISMLKQDKLKSGKTVIQLIEKPERLLATILISNNLINVGIVIISTFVTNAVFDFSNSPIWGFITQVVIITFMLLLFGEILPKVYAAQHSMRFAKLMAVPLLVLDKIFAPISNLLVRSTNIVNRKFAKNKSNISLDDLSQALDMTKDEELKEDEKILKGIVKFGNIDTKEIMVSRMDVKSVSLNTSLNKLKSLIVETGFSRIPVFDENFDNIKGILYIKDLLPHIHKGDSFRWQSLIRPPYYVPETKKINDLLEEFRKKKNHMAIVIDEYGGTSGIITLEDVLEEIVGDINDELDEAPSNFTEIDTNTYVFEAKTLLNDFYKILNTRDNIFDSVKGDADTLAGLILEIQGEIPQKHDVVTFEQFEFKIKSVDNRRIKQIIVKINDK